MLLSPSQSCISIHIDRVVVGTACMSCASLSRSRTKYRYTDVMQLEKTDEKRLLAGSYVLLVRCELVVCDAVAAQQALHDVRQQRNQHWRPEESQKRFDR